MSARVLAVMAAALAVVLVLWPAPAAAFVPSRTQLGEVIAWPGRLIVLVPDTTLPPGLDDDGVRVAMTAAADNWRRAEICSDLQLQIVEPQPGQVVGYDGRPDPVNVIRFVLQDWPHEPSAVALTTVTFVEGSGAALDADVEVNAAEHRFTVDPMREEPGGARDLESVLTHELGHVLGLEHTCDDGTQPGPVTDIYGEPVPRCCSSPGNCSVASARANLVDRPDITGATMFSFSDPGETQLRSLETDDVLGVCTLYPRTLAPPMASPDPGCQTVTSATATPPSASLATTVLLWLLLALRRPAREWAAAGG